MCHGHLQRGGCVQTVPSFRSVPLQASNAAEKSSMVFFQEVESKEVAVGPCAASMAQAAPSCRPSGKGAAGLGKAVGADKHPFSLSPVH